MIFVRVWVLFCIQTFFDDPPNDYSWQNENRIDKTGML
jgi:hypothetical protein